MLILDFTQEDCVARILPQPPLNSSYQLRWDNIYAQYHRQPAWITPEFSSSLHIILVNQSDRTILFEQIIDGSRQKRKLNQEQIAIFPANVRSGASWNCPMEFTLLFLKPTYINRQARICFAGEEINNVTIEPCLGVDDPTIATIALLFKQELESEQMYSDFQVEAMKKLLALTLLRQYSTRTNKESMPEDLQVAIAYINDYLASDLSLKKVAAIAKTSPYHFARLFKQSTGVTLNQYVTNCRMEKAKYLLRQQTYSVVEVAKLVGIRSQSHFNKVFRKYTGSTPKAYRSK